MDKKRILAVSSLILVLLSFILILSKNRAYCNVYYRVFTQEEGWSSWCKNGKVCGNDKNITAYQVKIKSNDNGNVFYESYQNGKWTKTSLDNEISGNKKDSILSIKAQLAGKKIRKKYNIYYRFMSDEKWTSWESDYTFNKVKKEDKPIKKIQIKIEGV